MIFVIFRKDNNFFEDPSFLIRLCISKTHAINI